MLILNITTVVLADSSRPTHLATRHGQASATSSAGADVNRMPWMKFAKRDFINFDLNADLQNPMVSALAQDRDGFLWVGTQFGLSRYDGHELKHFDAEQDNPFSLPHNYITVLHGASDGALWVGTAHAALAKYDPTNNQFIHFEHQPDAPNRSIAAKYINAIEEDQNGNIYVASTGGVNVITGGISASPADVNVMQIDGCDTLTQTKDHTQLVVSSNQLWISTLDGLCVVDLPPEPANRYTGRDIVEVANQDILLLGEAHNGLVWFKTSDNYLGHVNPTDGAVTISELNVGKAIRMIEPEPGKLWLSGFTTGILIIDAATLTQVDAISPQPGRKFALENIDVSRMIMDRSGVIWIGTWGSGLQKYTYANNYLRTLRFNPADPNSLSDPINHTILLLADGRLAVFGEKAGIDIFDGDSGKVDHIAYDFGSATGIADNIVAAVEAPAGTLWMGTTYHGLYRLDLNTKQLTRFTEDNGLLSPDVRYLYVNDKQLWVASASSIQIRDLATGNWTNMADNVRNMQLLERSVINDIEHLADGTLWISTNYNGVFVLASDSDELEQVSVESGNSNFLSDREVVRQLKKTPSGRFFLVGDQDTYEVLDHRQRPMVLRSEKEDMGGDPFVLRHDILASNDGRLWTYYVMHDPADGSYHKLPERREYSGRHVNYVLNAAIRTKDDTFLYSGNGMLIMRPDHYVPWNYQPPVRISELTIDNAELAFDHQQGITLPAHTQTLSATFSAMEFRAPKRIKYQYKLEGYDREWRDTNAENRHATYTNLPPGDYLLRVKSTNSEHQWSEQELQLAINKVPHWYQTTVFYWLVFLLFSALLYLLHQWRIARITAQNKALDKRVKERTEALNQSLSDLDNAHNELKQTQERLVIQEKMAALGTLTAGVAHEINNPAHFAQASLYSLKKQSNKVVQQLIELAGGEQADADIVNHIKALFDPLDEASETAHEGLERIIKIVADLKTFANSDDEHTELLELAEPIAATLKLLKAQYSDIQFNFDCQDEVRISGNRNRLMQVFMNLLVNACQAIRSQQQQDIAGVITIELSKNDQHARITITDNGCGIEPDVQSKIFEPFFSTKPVGDGMGLGLAIVFGILQAQNADIEVVSTPQQGTQVRLFFPLNSANNEER